MACRAASSVPAWDQRSQDGSARPPCTRDDSATARWMIKLFQHATRHSRERIAGRRRTRLLIGHSVLSASEPSPPAIVNRPAELKKVRDEFLRITDRHEVAQIVPRHKFLYRRSEPRRPLHGNVRTIYWLATLLCYKGDAGGHSIVATCVATASRSA